MRLHLRTEPFRPQLRDGEGAPVRAEQIRGELARQLGFNPDEPLVVPSYSHRVAVDVTLTDYGTPVVELGLCDDRPGDLALFEQGMEALSRARRVLALAAEGASPNWGVATSHGIESVPNALDGLLGHRSDLEANKASAFAAELRVSQAALGGLGSEEHVQTALAATMRPCRVSALELKFSIDREERSVGIAASRAQWGIDGSQFGQVVRAFFEGFLPERLPQRRARVAALTGVAAPVPLEERHRPWALRVSAALLVALAMLSWLVPVTVSWLVVGGIWWTVAIVVPMRMGRDLKRSLASVAGAASTFLGLVVAFGLLYGVIYHSSGSIHMAWIPSVDTPRLGEMFMLSLGLAVSAGTTDVALTGVARFVAFVELLLFFGTVAAVVGALGRRWLFDREVRITGQAPITELDDDWD